jgi:ATP-dependent DNA ligase
LVGEFMFGSQWSTHPDRAGRLYIFDCLVSEGRDISSLPYKDRYRAAVSATLQLGQPFNILPCYSISKLGEFWLTLREETEGFIIRRWSSPWDATLFKLKFEVEDDFVVMGIIEGQGKHLGKMGALMLGQYNNGRLEHVMDCGGGFSNAQRVWWRENYYAALSEQAKVVQIKGKGRFNTGALRHPNFVRIRDDKLPSQCLLKKEQSK